MAYPTPIYPYGSTENEFERQRMIDRFVNDDTPDTSSPFQLHDTPLETSPVATKPLKEYTSYERTLRLDHRHHNEDNVGHPICYAHGAHVDDEDRIYSVEEVDYLHKYQKIIVQEREVRMKKLKRRVKLVKFLHKIHQSHTPISIEEKIMVLEQFKETFTPNDVLCSGRLGIMLSYWNLKDIAIDPLKEDLKYYD